MGMMGMGMGMGTGNLGMACSFSTELQPRHRLLKYLVVIRRDVVDTV